MKDLEKLSDDHQVFCFLVQLAIDLVKKEIERIDVCRNPLPKYVYFLLVPNKSLPYSTTYSPDAIRIPSSRVYVMIFDESAVQLI